MDLFESASLSNSTLMDTPLEINLKLHTYYQQLIGDPLLYRTYYRQLVGVPFLDLTYYRHLWIKKW